MSREVELGCESWTSFASGSSSTAVQQTLYLWLCPARQLKQQLRSALVTGQRWGDTAVTLPLFWRQSTVSPVFFGQYPQRAFILSFPNPPSLILISHLASVDIKQNGPINHHKGLAALKIWLGGVGGGALAGLSLTVHFGFLFLFLMGCVLQLEKLMHTTEYIIINEAWKYLPVSSVFMRSRS